MADLDADLDAYFDAARRYAAEHPVERLEPAPRRGLVVLTCMDARVDPLPLLGLARGDAHVLRNAGGRATVDALRSIALSTHLMHTRLVLVIHHTQCALTGASEPALHDRIGDVGMPFGSAPDEITGLKEALATISSSRLFPVGVEVAGLLYDVETHTLTPLR